MAVGQVACLAAIVLAGRASAERPSSGGQGVWVAVAVAAAIISSAGNGIWLAVLRRVTNGRRQFVFARLAVQAESAIAGSTGPAGAYVMVSGLTLRHRPDCPLVAGKAVVPASTDARPCGWCSHE
jgi:hypothetical protein